MRFPFLAVLASCSQILQTFAHPSTSPTSSASQVVAAAQKLQAAIIPYQRDINNTVAAFGSKSLTAKQAATKINTDLKAVYALVNTSVFPSIVHRNDERGLDSSAAASLARRQTGGDLITILIAEFFGLAAFFALTAYEVSMGIAQGDPGAFLGDLPNAISQIIIVYAMDFLQALT